MDPLQQLALVFDLSLYRWSIWGSLYGGAALLMLLLGALVLSGRGSVASQALRRAFALDMLLVAGSLAAVGACVIAGDAEHATAVTRAGIGVSALLGPATLNFAAVLVGWRRPLRAWIVAAALTGAAFGGLALITPLVIAGARPSPWGWFASAGPLALLAFLHLGACMTASMAIIAGRWRHAEDPRTRRQMRAAFLAYAIGNLTLFDTLPLWGVTVVPSAYLWITISALILANAIREHQLLDAPDFGFRALAWALTSALVALPIAIILYLTRDWIGWRQPLASAGLLFGMFVLVRAYHARLQPRIDDLFLRRRRDLARELERLSESLLVLRTAEAIAEEVARLTHRTLYARLTGFAVRQDGEWRVVHSAWGPLPLPEDDDPLLRRLAGEPQLTARAGLADERLFERWGAEVLLPVAGPVASPLEGRLEALVGVGPRWDGRPFEPFELAFLARVPHVVAGPLAAARLYDRRHQLRQELENKVAAKSADLARALAGLSSAQHQLVQNEKMATLGVVVGGVASELTAAIEEAHGHVADLQSAAKALEDAATAHLDGVPDGPAGDKLRAWRESSGFDFVREDVTQVVQAIVEGTRRASGIAADLSRFARAGGDRAEPLDLHRELDATLNLLRHAFKDRIEVVRRFADGVPSVLGERGPLGQVFMNLIMNAAQAIEGRGRIVLTTTLVEEGHAVCVSVKDSGKGIPAENLSRIFEPFFTTKPLAQQGGGSGLGLSISYGIVQRHGGKIVVDSVVGEGTEMKVVLPLAGPTRLRSAEREAVSA